eukprot:CAMPEP_0167745234 /NCGR_PEP_ID=MMETSP0110_2-20121227/3040_1 /TAXON_ID=629695 /ORGANISM="Gymnochlora sp., Strain CCMP2014" /LENGTH=661 /DNA_ID=CAMNT_0007629857 /DNA_START=269 /DNA_END=2254 /DNA_ORIENTATION=-
MVSTYASNCGIATYSQHLRSAMLKYAKSQNLGMKVDIIQVTKDRTESFHEDVIYQIDTMDSKTYEEAATYVSENYDVVLIHHEYNIFGGLHGEYIRNFILRLDSKVRVQLVMHTTEPDTSVEKEILMRVLASSSNDVIALSEAGCSVARMWIKDKECHVIPHGAERLIESNDAKEIKKAKKEAKLSVGFHEKDFVMMAAGILRPGKGLERTLRTLPALINEYNDVYFILVGRAQRNYIDGEHKNYVDALRQLAAELGVESHFITVDKFTDDEELALHLKASDVYVASYDYLGQSSSGMIPLAMSAGCVVVASPFLYAQETLNYDRGIIMPSESKNYLIMAITRLLRDRTLLMKMAINAAKYSASFSWPVVAALHVDLILTKEDNTEVVKVHSPKFTLMDGYKWVTNANDLIVVISKTDPAISMGVKTKTSMFPEQVFKIAGCFLSIGIFRKNQWFSFSHRFHTKMNHMKLHEDELGLTVIEEFTYSALKDIIIDYSENEAQEPFLYIEHTYRVENPRTLHMKSSIRTFGHGDTIVRIHSAIIGMEHLSSSSIDGLTHERNHVDVHYKKGMETFKNTENKIIDSIIVRTTKTDSSPDSCIWTLQTEGKNFELYKIKNQEEKENVNYIHAEFRPLNDEAMEMEQIVENTFEIRTMNKVAAPNK